MSYQLPITIGPRKGLAMTFGDHSTESWPWVVTGVDWATARALLLAVTPIQSPTGNWRQTLTQDEDKQAAGIWFATVVYGPVQPPDPSTWQWEYDATPESVHATCSRECLNVFINGSLLAASPGKSTAIGETPEGLEGADCLSTATSWTEQHQLWATAVPFGYGDALSQLEAQTNQAAFRGYAAGRVLFLGGNLKRSSKDPEWIDANFKFKLDAQRTINLGSGSNAITGIVVPPHCIVDAHFQQVSDTTANVLQRQLEYVRVHRMYDPGDFSKLGLGS